MDGKEWIDLGIVVVERAPLVAICWTSRFGMIFDLMDL